MPVNADKPDRWKADIARSVDTYNSWFMKFAPTTYRNARVIATKEVTSALALTKNLEKISPDVLKKNPEILPILRMSTAPPIARDRLVGLGQIHAGLVDKMETEKRIPPNLIALENELKKIGTLIMRLVDKDIFTWVDSKKKKPTKAEILRASTIIADRLCGAAANPIIRNSQEERQLKLIGHWLDLRGYSHVKITRGLKFNHMIPGTYAFHLNIPANLSTGIKQVKIPVDAVIMPRNSKQGDFPLLVEAKSAGDFTNTNKRRKEEGMKIAHLKGTHGPSIRYILFLCGYFGSEYLGYEAAEGIDWVWEHRIDDIAEFGI